MTELKSLNITETHFFLNEDGSVYLLSFISKGEKMFSTFLSKIFHHPPSHP